MTTYRDRHHAGLHDADPEKREKAEAKAKAAEQQTKASTKTASSKKT